jgi:predicted transcriptional regulator YheO
MMRLSAKTARIDRVSPRTSAKQKVVSPSRDTILSRYQATADAIARLLNPHAEVVIHDLITGRIVYIANAFSKRVVGDLSLVDQDDDLSQEGPVLGPYEKDLADGRSLRSVTTVISDFEGQEIGFLCVNLDLTPFDGVRKAVESLLQLNGASSRPATLFAQDWQEKINTVTAAFLRERSCTLAALSKSDRVELVARIDETGLFEARGAADYVARELVVSRAALYRYLGESRSG